MDKQECYEWAKIFNSPWESLLDSMFQRAKAMGLSQEEKHSTLIWLKDGNEQCR